MIILTSDERIKNAKLAMQSIIIGLDLLYSTWDDNDAKFISHMKNDEYDILSLRAQFKNRLDYTYQRENSL